MITGLIVGLVSFIISKIVGAANYKVFADAKKRKATDTEKKIAIIATNDKLNEVFAESIDSLNKMLDSKLIDHNEYEQKSRKLIDDNYNKTIQLQKSESDLKNDALLEDALNKKIISKDEYEDKRSSFAKDLLKPKLILDKSVCPACNNRLRDSDEECQECGLQI